MASPAEHKMASLVEHKMASPVEQQPPSTRRALFAARPRLDLGAVELSLPAGTFTALLGAPGSGKSALMRMLAGARADGAKVTALGQDVTRLPADRRGFGVVRQPDTLAARLTIAANVARPLRGRRVAGPEVDLLVAETLSQFGLSHLAIRLPDQVSPAERQRAVAARAVVCQPQLLLLDEPMSDQDLAGRAELAASLRRVHALLGATTLLATQSGTDALAAADHIAVLREGRVIQHDSAQAVYDRPASAYAARLLGEVNLLPASLDALFDDTASLRLACGPLAETLMPAPGLHQGDACLMMLRPERIALAPVTADEMGEGALDATVLEARCQGESWHISLLIGTGSQIVVRRPSAAGLRGVVPGARVAIAWQPHHALALPAEPA